MGASARNSTLSGLEWCIPSTPRLVRHTLNLVAEELELVAVWVPSEGCRFLAGYLLSLDLTIWQISLLHIGRNSHMFSQVTTVLCVKYHPWQSNDDLVQQLLAYQFFT
jgi:hypothetical protein